MVWTSAASPEFYKRFVRTHREHFSEETIEEAERAAHLHQSSLSDFAEAA